LKRALALLVKLSVSLCLLVYLFSNTDLVALERRVRTGDTVLFASGALLYSAMLLLATWRWRLLLQAQGCDASLRQLSASYLVATFFNNFLPSNIGGDLVRVRDGSRLTGSTTTSLAVVAVDRILGFGALYALALAAYSTGGPALRRLMGARPVVVGLGLVFAALAYVFFRPGTTRRLMARTGLARFPWAQERFAVAQAAVQAYRDRVGGVLRAFAASLALQAIFVCYYYAVAHALRVPLGLGACFLMVPLCTLVQAVPVSFNGWGVREAVFTVYFAQVGLSRDSAMAFSLVGAGLIVLLSLPGAVVWTWRGPTSPHANTES
jgi:uncharacterized membrane protein YbhN (UPF0104 family)